jgi:site-specific recombinase XerD
LWTRTTDPSLIRIGGTKVSHIVNSKNPALNRSLPDYIDSWQKEQYLKGIVKSTVYGYRKKIEALFRNYPAPNELDVKSFLTEKQQTGSLSGTIANYVKAYRSFFRYLFDRGLYDIDPSWFKLPKIHYRERRVPTSDAISRIMNVTASKEDELIFMLFLDCGIRVTELASIKLKNINLTDASIMINGKGGKDRIVYLSEATVGSLRAYVSYIKGEYLFPVTRVDAKTGYHSRRYFEERLSEWCEKADVEHITPHQLRHYFATHTLSNGADVKAVSEMLGHADVGITLKIYHHVNAKSIRQMHREFSPLVNMVIQ